MTPIHGANSTGTQPHTPYTPATRCCPFSPPVLITTTCCGCASGATCTGSMPPVPTPGITRSNALRGRPVPGIAPGTTGATRGPCQVPSYTLDAASVRVSCASAQQPQHHQVRKSHSAEPSMPKRARIAARRDAAQYARQMEATSSIDARKLALEASQWLSWYSTRSTCSPPSPSPPPTERQPPLLGLEGHTARYAMLRAESAQTAARNLAASCTQFMRSARALFMPKGRQGTIHANRQDRQSVSLPWPQNWQKWPRQVRCTTGSIGTFCIYCGGIGADGYPIAGTTLGFWGVW
mmetsp:Transcript_25644/g.65111  ORF Transcript_25644/g.65111 Transcript_25644/m.65111 type:complete len:294 (-) Transcript_25644:179-1060(-)